MSLYHELKKFSGKERASFHIPGHKAGNGLSRSFKADAFRLDVTEFEETDDLQRPEGILRDAQRRAARAFGAGTSFYLTNGSSIGLHAAVLGSCKRGDKLLLDRTCHKAVAAAVTLAGLEPVFVYPAFDRDLGIYTGVAAQMVKRALDRDPDIVGAVITSPTYYGICSDIWGIAMCLHNSGKFLIVDEAHGAHFAFHEALPGTALEQGADLCIQSAHKTLPAMGQCSLLHVGRNAAVEPEEIRRTLRILQTTSPSYLLMASLDEAVLDMERRGRRSLDRLIREVTELKAAVRGLGVLDFVDGGRLDRPQDPLRLVADFRKTGISGQCAARILKEAFGIYPEMADHYHVVFVITAANTRAELALLREALIRFSRTRLEPMPGPEPLPLPDAEMAMNPAAAWAAPRVQVPLQEAAGETAAGIVAACPPGAAVLIPGQRISAAAVEYIRAGRIADTIEIVAE